MMRDVVSDEALHKPVAVVVARVPAQGQRLARRHAGGLEQVRVQLALEELRFFAKELKILGVYPAHPFRDKHR